MAILKEISTSAFEKTYKVLYDWADLFYNTYKDKLNAVRSSGELQDTMTFGVRYDEREFEVYLDLQSYWRYIEDGRLAGSFPPVNSIIQWIREKPIIPQPFNLPSGRIVIPTENQLAFLIGRKIKKDGIAPNPLLMETSNELRLGLVDALKQAFSEDILDIIELDFQV